MDAKGHAVIESKKEVLVRCGDCHDNGVSQNQHLTSYTSHQTITQGIATGNRTKSTTRALVPNIICTGNTRAHMYLGVKAPHSGHGLTGLYQSNALLVSWRYGGESINQQAIAGTTFS